MVCMPTVDRRRVAAGAAGVVALLVVLTGCGSSTGGSSPSATSPAPVGPRIEVSPSDGATGVEPLAPVLVQTPDGTFESVTMTNEDGRTIDGIVTPDRHTWKPTGPLGYGRSYTVTATAIGADGTRSDRTTGFTTLTPDNQTAVVFRTTGGGAVSDGGVYGVGLVVVAHFDEPIPDRAAAEKTLTVQANPPVDGAWYWADEQNAHWRPRSYYPPGTQVTVRADIYGKPLGGGLFGQEDASVSFSLGDAHISVADDDTIQVTVTDNGQIVRTMPTSMGRGGTEVVDGRTLSFWTQPGIYTVLDQANPVVMDSSTYGLPVNSRLGYKEVINYATRISNDGIYLHQLDATVWAQGNTNVSHGCLNLSGADARWFYEFSRPGDVVEVRNTGGAPLQLWQNGDWSIPWEQWQAGSALR